MVSAVKIPQEKDLLLKIIGSIYLPTIKYFQWLVFSEGITLTPVAKNIFVFNLKSLIFTKLNENNLIFGTRITQNIFQNILFFSKKFNRRNPLKSTICTTFIIKRAVSRAIRGKNYQHFLVFSAFLFYAFSRQKPQIQ